ncbi:MAG: CAP domain-containing protein [Bacteroidales bacterium]|nr:CAP domain-containing protein [Clostridium sp.]MCM1203354.1 CAP domain-containing protein [Bacteroidales bacterium]
MRKKCRLFLLTAAVILSGIAGRAVNAEGEHVDGARETSGYELSKENGAKTPPEIPLKDSDISEERQQDIQTANRGDALQEETINSRLAAEGTDTAVQDMTEVKFDYDSAGDIMEQYVTKDQKTVKLLNNRNLYSYDIAAKKITLKYTFPKAEYSKTGTYYGGQGGTSAFIREEAGLLYYGYNAYTNTFSDDEVMNVVVYDLEKDEVVRTIQIEGYILDSVGADRQGNIYISTDDMRADSAAGDSRESNTLLVVSAAGDRLSEKQLDYPINGFSGFCADGTFYYIDEYMAYSAWGYANLMGRLMQGRFQNNVVTLNETYMTYAKNIYFGDYRTPVEILNDRYLVTYSGGFYPLSEITDSSWSQSLYTERKLEMGSEYDYIYNAGVNAVINGDDVYSLYDNQTLFVYSMATGSKKGVYYAGAKIFSLKKCGDALLALETDGEHFFYELITADKVEEVKAVSYNMNKFAPYKNRTKAEIIKRFSDTAPADMEATLYAAKGSGEKPYKAGKLTKATKNYAVKVSNYYRWLAGLTPFETASDEKWENAAKGAVLLSASSFSHTPAKPKDMDKTFYDAAYSGTSSSSIAMNYSDKQYKIVDTIRQFMDDTSYTIPGHRNNFLTRNATDIAYGIYGPYLCQTVSYTGDPNPQGTAEKDNNEAAYAWPAAGYFPAEDLSPAAYWTVNLNMDKLSLSNVGLVVKITDLDTGKTEKRTSSEDGLYATEFWGEFISFKPPTLKNASSYKGKRYKVTLENLADENGFPAVLEYTVNFFSYSAQAKQDGTVYQCDAYGQPKKLQAPVIKAANTASGVKVSWGKVSGAAGYEVYRNGALVKTTTAASFTDKGAKKNGAKYQYKVIAVKGKLRSTASKVKTCYFVSRPAVASAKSPKSGRITVKWKLNAKASGYQIKYVSGKSSGKVTVSGKKKTSGVVKQLEKGKTYKIYLRTYKKVGKVKYYSAWSKVKKVKVR